MNLRTSFTVYAWFETKECLVVDNNECDIALAEMRTLIIRHVSKKGYPRKISLYISQESDFLEILINHLFLVFCYEHKISFDIVYTCMNVARNPQLQQLGSADFICMGKRVDRTQISDLLEIPHSSYRVKSWGGVPFPRYWRGQVKEQQIIDASIFLQVVLEKWSRRKEKLIYLSQEIRGFSAEIFFDLKGISKFDFSVSAQLLCALGKTSSSIRLFMYA